MNEAKRMDLIVEASNIVNEEVGEGVISFGDAVVVSSPTVHTFKPDAYGFFWQPQVMWGDAR